MPQESFWFLYIVLHKYLFYLCICQGHKYVEEHRYTFQLLICAAADVAGFDWTNSLPQTAKLLRWIRSSVHVSDCHTGPCVLSIGIGIKWYFLPPPLPEKETHQKKCGRWRGNLRVWLRNEEHSLPTQMWWQPGRDEKPAVPGGPLKSFSNLLLMRRSRAASAHSLHLFPWANHSLKPAVLQPLLPLTFISHLWLFDTSGHNSYFAISMQSNFCHNYCRVGSRVRQSPAPWACLCFPLGVKPLKQPFSIQQSQVRALCHG